MGCAYTSRRYFIILKRLRIEIEHNINQINFYDADTNETCSDVYSYSINLTDKGNSFYIEMIDRANPYYRTIKKYNCSIIDINGIFFMELEEENR